MSAVVDDLLARLRDRGSRVTQPRRIVIDALVSGHDHHLTAAEIVESVRRRNPGFYESTVYRTLDRLVELGVVERVQLGSGAAIFHLPESPHHHLVCDDCGAVSEVPAGVVVEFAERLFDEYGFVLRGSSATITGRCRACSSRR